MLIRRYEADARTCLVAKELLERQLELATSHSIAVCYCSLSNNLRVGLPSSARFAVDSLLSRTTTNITRQFRPRTNGWPPKDLKISSTTPRYSPHVDRSDHTTPGADIHSPLGIRRRIGHQSSIHDPTVVGPPLVTGYPGALLPTKLDRFLFVFRCCSSAGSGPDTLNPGEPHRPPSKPHQLCTPPARHRASIMSK